MIRDHKTLARPMLLLALSCSTAAVAQTLVAQTPARPADAPSMDSVDAIFSRYDKTTTPGCSVAVIDHGKVVLKKSYGMADISLGVPMTSSTTSWIPYSEARVFVALAVAMLARDGEVSLDDPIRKHVPEVPAYAAAVTVRQLLHHTSGLADYGVLAGPGWEIHDRMSEDEMFRMLARWNKLGFAPGQDKMYSNTDYALLKILVERIGKGSLHAYLEETLLRPLNMTGTRIGADQGAVSPGHALFHEIDGDGYRRLLRYRVNPVGEIAVTTNLDDLVRWERALDDPALGLRTLLAGLEAGARPHTSDAGKEGYAFGVYQRTYEGVPLVEYHGIGEFAYLVQVPTDKLSVATLCNAYDGMWLFGADVARLYASPRFQVETATQVPTPPRTPPVVPALSVVVPPAELKRHVGEFRTMDGKVAMQIAAVDGGLVVSFRGQDYRATALGNGRFEVIRDGTAAIFDFSDTEAGSMALAISNASTGESEGPAFKRWQARQPTAEALGSFTGTYMGDDVELIYHVTADDKQARISGRGLPETVLAPQEQADLFRVGSYTLEFNRATDGRVMSFTLDAPRVKGMRFSRR